MDHGRVTDILANERTLLAYVRTALAFIAFGFVIARFSLFTREFGALTHARHLPSSSATTVFGMAMEFAGIAAAVFGAYRYISCARAIRAGAANALSERAAIVSAIAISAIGLFVAWTLFLPR